VTELTVDVRQLHAHAKDSFTVLHNRRKIEAATATVKEQSITNPKGELTARIEQIRAANGSEQSVKAAEHYHSLNSPARSCVSIMWPLAFKEIFSLLGRQVGSDLKGVLPK
jgi:hypothetical protein